ncbi:MAG: hypothetical protein IJW53_04725 [Clostridia bacterium]|nr:hypothetical protein [Clostridia bacterium]
MRISITSENKSFNLRFPTRLAFTRLGLSFLKKAHVDLPENFSSRDLKRLYRVIKESRKIHKDWYVVEVESSDGENVKIKL